MKIQPIRNGTLKIGYAGKTILVVPLLSFSLLIILGLLYKRYEVAHGHRNGITQIVIFNEEESIGLSLQDINDDQVVSSTDAEAHLRFISDTAT